MADLQPNFDLQLSRFGPTTSDERKKIMDKCNARNTNKATKSTLGILTDYLKEKNKPELKDIETEDLPDILLQFYMNVKKSDGDDYCVQSMKCIRAGINRHLKAERRIDIISSDLSVKANEMFCEVNKQRCIDGKGSVKSTPAITDEDLETISRYFHHDLRAKCLSGNKWFKNSQQNSSVSNASHLVTHH